jgi:hypothetical protein
MATGRAWWLVAAALVATAVVGAGCGSSAHRTATSTASRTAAAGPAAVAVIRAWSTALRRGDVAAAARYFALPSEFVNGPSDIITIRTEAEAQQANASLPCGALLISTSRRGPFISALFRLTNRQGPDAGCGAGTGQLARTFFIIEGGHIVHWIRALDAGGGAVPPPGIPPPAPTGGPIV